MPEHDPPGDAPAPRLGRYVIEGELGRGTMGVVYRAFDPELGRPLALKTIHTPFGQAADERAAFERRFLSEARAAAGLSHPGIVVVHDLGRDAQTGLLFIALERLEGRTLAELTADGLPWPWPEALRLTARVAEALHHAHERGVIHRDVKPANVMVLPSGEPKIMDFGIARVSAAQLTSPGEALGTPLYMSPEQALGAPLDARSDVFSLGAVLYLLLTGRRAFEAPNVPAILARVTQADPLPPSRFVELPEDVDYVVARALAKSAAARYADARALAEDLEDVRAGLPPRHRAGWVPPAPRDAELAGLDTGREPPTEPAGRQTATFAQPAARARARRSLAVALVTLVGVTAAAWLAWRWRSPDAGASLPELPGFSILPTPEPGRLEIDFSHTLREGLLRVYADDELVVEQALESRVTGKLLFVYKKRQGSVSETLELSPGSHELRFVVESGEDRWAQRISGDFESGQTRRLLARLAGSGVLRWRKDLDLYWAPPTPEPTAAASP